MGRHKKSNRVVLTSIAVSPEVADAINKHKRKGETQDQALKRLLTLADNTEAYRRDSEDWEKVYHEQVWNSTRRVQMLEAELASQNQGKSSSISLT